MGTCSGKNKIHVIVNFTINFTYLLVHVSVLITLEIILAFLIKRLLTSTNESSRVFVYAKKTYEKKKSEVFFFFFTCFHIYIFFIYFRFPVQFIKKKYDLFVTVTQL